MILEHETGCEETNMAETLEIINEKLDKVLCEFFEKLEELQSARNALANAMKNGYLLMSKARYSMGNKSVSSLQYGEKNMGAGTTVFTNDNFLTHSGEEKEGTTRKEQKVFRLCLEGDGAGPEKSETAVVDQNPESFVRRRVHSKNDNKKDLVVSNEAEKEEELIHKKVVKKSSDPLKWFGVLVPSSLRQCQQEFKSSCQLLCDIASLECEIKQIMGAYKQLKEQKNTLKSQNT